MSDPELINHARQLLDRFLIASFDVYVSRYSKKFEYAGNEYSIITITGYKVIFAFGLDVNKSFRKETTLREGANYLNTLFGFMVNLLTDCGYEVKYGKHDGRQVLFFQKSEDSYKKSIDHINNLQRMIEWMKEVSKPKSFYDFNMIQELQLLAADTKAEYDSFEYDYYKKTQPSTPSTPTVTSDPEIININPVNIPSSSSETGGPIINPRDIENPQEVVAKYLTALTQYQNTRDPNDLLALSAVLSDIDHRYPLLSTAMSMIKANDTIEDVNRKVQAIIDSQPKSAVDSLKSLAEGPTIVSTLTNEQKETIRATLEQNPKLKDAFTRRLLYDILQGKSSISDVKTLESVLPIDKTTNLVKDETKRKVRNRKGVRILD